MWDNCELGGLPSFNYIKHSNYCKKIVDWSILFNTTPKHLSLHVLLPCEKVIVSPSTASFCLFSTWRMVIVHWTPASMQPLTAWGQPLALMTSIKYIVFCPLSLETQHAHLSNILQQQFISARQFQIFFRVFWLFLWRSFIFRAIAIQLLKGYVYYSDNELNPHCQHTCLKNLTMPWFGVWFDVGCCNQRP